MSKEYYLPETKTNNFPEQGQKSINTYKDNNNNYKNITDLLQCPLCKKLTLVSINKEKLILTFNCENSHFLRNTVSTPNEYPSTIELIEDNTHSTLLTNDDVCCLRHNKSQFNKYCFDCKRNLCENCLKNHFNHNLIDYEKIRPSENELKSIKNEINKSFEYLNKINEDLNMWRKELDHKIYKLQQTIKNIFLLRKYIIENYISEKNSDNCFNFIHNFNTFKNIELLIPEIIQFSKAETWKIKGYILVELLSKIKCRFSHEYKIIPNKTTISEAKTTETEIGKINAVCLQTIDNIEKIRNIYSSEILRKKNTLLSILNSGKELTATDLGAKLNYNNMEDNTEIINEPQNNYDMNNKQIKENEEDKKNHLGLPSNIITSFNTTYCSNWNNNDFYSSSYIKLKIKAKELCQKKRYQSSGKVNKILNKNHDNLENNSFNSKNILNKTIDENDELEKNEDELENINKLNNDAIIVNDNQDNNNNININTNNISTNNVTTSQLSINNITNDNQININISNNNQTISEQVDNNETKNNKITNNNIYENAGNFYHEGQKCNNDISEDINIIDKNKEKDKIINCYENKNKNNKKKYYKFVDSNAVDYKLNSLRLNPSIIREVKTNSSFPFNTNNQNDINNDLKEFKKEQFELINTDIIRSIEFISDNKLLIATLKNLSIYKINYNNYELSKEYDIKEFNYRINYVTKLANGHLIICSYNIMNIIELKNDFVLSKFRKYTLIQKLKGRRESGNINKVIEIIDKNYLISCDEAFIITWHKNPDKKYYEKQQNIKIDSEVKCICYINDNKFVALLPSSQYLFFYDTEDTNYIKIINNIQSSYGRYVICYVDKYKCIFVTGRQGIYLISTTSYSIIRFFRIKEWITSINYNFYNDHLLCGTWKKKSGNKKKYYNFIRFQVRNEEENEENNKNNKYNEKELNLCDKVTLKELGRKNEAHLHDIVVIKSVNNYNDIIITGSNDLSVKFWK